MRQTEGTRTAELEVGTQRRTAPTKPGGSTWVGRSPLIAAHFSVLNDGKGRQFRSGQEHGLVGFTPSYAAGFAFSLAE